MPFGNSHLTDQIVPFLNGRSQSPNFLNVTILEGPSTRTLQQLLSLKFFIQMSEFNEQSDYTAALEQELQQELPSIYASVKNLIACLLGKTYVSPLEPSISPQNVMTCSKFLLQAIRSHVLVDVKQFCEENLLRINQTEAERLDEICKYKVAFEQRKKTAEKGGKIIKLFGRSYLQWSKCWPKCREETTNLIAENTSITPEEVKLFLDTYEESLNLNGKFCFLNRSDW